MNLSIDLGNTFSQAAFFEKRTLKKHFQKLSFDELQELIKSYQPKNIVVSDVNKTNQEFLNICQKQSNLLVLTQQTAIPLHNHYQTPQTLGTDRLAAVMGANALYPDFDTMVVDMGTCITYDFVDSQKNYWGGNISPGLQMRLRAMHEFTARLPLFSSIEAQTEQANDIGTSTKTAMLLGATEGINLELQGMINRYNSRFRKFNIILCGGDAHFFESKIKHTIFVNQKLVLIGLNEILLYQDEIK